MKRIILILTTLSLSILVGILLISKNKRVIEEETYYTIPQTLTYFYEEGKMMQFMIYANTSKSLIEFPEENTYTLVVQNNQFQLYDITIEKEMDSSILDQIFYKYTITTPILSISNQDLILEDVFLLIKNEKFNLKCLIGDMAIYKADYQPLAFKDLYGNYTYIGTELHFIGFTIGLDANYKNLEFVSIVKAYSPLDYIEKDTLHDSQRDISDLAYPIIHEKEVYRSYRLNARNNYYYIPIAYLELSLITNACILLQIDGKMYYISDFTYLANSISLCDYPDIKRQGEYRNA